jgi:hypothetical protein
MAEHVIQGGAGAKRGLELGRRAGGPDPARMHQRDAVTVSVGLVHVVSGHQYGHGGAPPEPGNVLPDVGARYGVQAYGGLVKYEQPGRADQGLGQFQPPDHAARVGLHQAAGRFGQAHDGQRGGSSFWPIFPWHVEQPGEELDVLLSGQHRVS